MQARSWKFAGWSVLLLAAALAAQTTSKPPNKAAALKSYCHPDLGYCFNYPSTWEVLGQVFEGNGVVVAPTQKSDQELWDEVTVTLIIPAPQGNEEPVSIGEAIERAVSSVRKTGQNFETLERRQRAVDGQPAEMVKLHYVEQGTGREWTEELVFIEGTQSEIYSVALKTSPLTLARMEPQFTRIVDSWKLPKPETNDEDATTPKPKTPRPNASEPQH